MKKERESEDAQKRESGDACRVGVLLTDYGDDANWNNDDATVQPFSQFTSRTVRE